MKYNTEYIAFQFTPNCDIENVNILIEVSGISNEAKEALKEIKKRNEENDPLTTIYLTFFTK